MAGQVHAIAHGALTGVQLVVSSRTHRRVAATGGAACEEFELKPFTIQETGEFLRQRLDGHTEARTHVYSPDHEVIIGYNVQSHQQSLGLQPETLDGAVALSRRRGLAQ